MKNTILMILPVIAAMACSVWADDCKMPQATVYSAPLAQKFIGYIQASLPTVQFNTASSQIDNNGYGVELKTVDGTALYVSGNFQIVAKDIIDNEGNITGCTLGVASGNGVATYINSVTNIVSEHDILGQLLTIGSPYFDLGIQYPYSR